MNYIDTKFIGLLSNRLQRFKRLSDNTFTFRCPICGDSQKNKSKTRGYIYQKTDKALFFCHNCQASMLFGNLLKTVDPELFRDYTHEKFIDKNSAEPKASPVDITKIVHPKYITDSPLRSLKKVSQLEWNHPVKQYINKRMIPTRFHAKLFYAPKFKKWVNTIVPDKFNTEDGDEPRLIIPFLDKEKNCFGIQGRSFKKDGLRYITIMFDENKPKIFGLDDVDFSKLVYIVEGPIDSMFLPNAIAMAGSSAASSFLTGLTRNFVMVMDNEPRNEQIIKQVEKHIDNGYNVCMWPDYIPYKDVNDMVMGGMTSDEIKAVIDSNTFNGLQAKMRLVSWRKI